MPLFRVALVFVLAFSVRAEAAPISAQQDYKKIQAYLRELVAQYPEQVELFDIGAGGTGEKIEGIKIGHGPVKHLLVATHHGNEYGSTEVALASAADLAKSPLDGKTVFVLPVLNISGFNHGRREESLKGVSGETADPNRDYPGPGGSDGPFNLKSTKALADFVDREGIVALATLHTFQPAVTYPWGFTTPDISTPYEQQFIDLARMAVEVSGYAVGNAGEVIYPANGTFEDYAFWKHGIWSLLFELGDTHNPTDADLAELGRVNVPGIRKMFDRAPLVRAADHAFRGRCDSSMRSLDLRSE